MEKKTGKLFWILGIFIFVVIISLIYTKSSQIMGNTDSKTAQVVENKSIDENKTNVASTTDAQKNITVTPPITEENKKTDNIKITGVNTDASVTPAVQTNNIFTNTVAPTLVPTKMPVAQKTYPHDFTLKDLDGKNVSLADYRGKIVILNFWATWCKYCVLEMPEFNALNETFQKDNDVVILAIDVQEDSDKVSNFVYANDIDLNVLLDSDASISEKYNISGFPTTYFINRDGSIATSIVGATNKEAVLNVLKTMK